MEDPFFVVKSEVENSLGTVQQLYSNWKNLLQSTNTSGNEEFQWTTEELKKNIKNIEWDLQDLDETINIVNSNPEKFKLDRKEIKIRQQFVANTRKSIEDIVADLSSPATKGKIDKDQRESLMASNRKNDRLSKIERAKEMENQDFIDQNSPQVLMRQQDDQLDQVSHTVGNLKNIALTIGNELEDQERLLEEVESRVDNTQGKLKSALKRVEKVYKDSNEKGSLLCIGFLVIAIVILAILALTL